MEILLTIAAFAGLAWTAHLLNRRDAARREIIAATRFDPRLANELMCARDRQRTEAVAPARAARSTASTAPVAPAVDWTLAPPARA